MSRLIEKVRDGQRFGTPFTIRSLCRALAGKFPGLGRVKLEKLVGRLLQEGKLVLEDGENDNGVKVRYLALGS